MRAVDLTVSTRICRTLTDYRRWTDGSSTPEEVFTGSMVACKAVLSGPFAVAADGVVGTNAEIRTNRSVMMVES